MVKYRLAFITGATSGIGKEICKLFAKKGIDLLISGRDQEQLRFLKDKLSEQVNIETLEADLLQPKDRQSLIQAIHRLTPDLVVNSAGFGLYGEALTYPTQEQLNILELNGQALLEITLEAARTLISVKKQGIIFNLSSAAGFHVFPSMAVYAASKAFVNSFSEAFDFEVKRYGIRILTVCPGMVATEFQKRAGGAIHDQQLGVMTASFVAEKVWRQIERLDRLSIIDWKYRLLTWFSYLMPTSWVAAFNQRAIDKRIVPRTLIEIER